MGSCCGTKSNKVKDYSSISHHERQYERQHRSRSEEEENRLPKVIFISQDTGLIYLDTSSTETSKEFEHSIKRTFPNLVTCDHQKRILHRIQMMKERRFYLIIAGHISEETLRLILRNRQMKGIYFILTKNDHHLQHFKSSKIKGFFSNGTKLKKRIYEDIRYDES